MGFFVGVNELRVVPSFVETYSMDFSHKSFLTHVYSDYRKQSVYAPFCLLHGTLVEFYKLELERHQRKLASSVWTDSYDMYYRKKLLNCAMVVMRFTMSALVGEARHAPEQVIWGSSKSDRGKEVRVKKYVLNIMGSLGCTSVPKDRSVVFKCFIAEKKWMRWLFMLRHVFNDVHWGSNFGGKKWANGCSAAIRLYRSLCMDESSEKITIYLDTLIHTLHNGGFLLNKFDCPRGCVPKIKVLLDEKTDGGLGSTWDNIYNVYSCHDWKQNICYGRIRVLPVRRTEK